MQPLKGVRVLAVEQYGAGPFGTMFLSDQGAEVIKIEDPRFGGDMARDVGPYFFGERDSLFFHSFNRNKKSITLDLSNDEGQAVFHDLVASADAVTSNLRGDVPAKLGLTYETLGAYNPTIVCAHLSAYGREGPRASWPGYDYLMQAEAGYFPLTGEPDGPPTRFGLSVVDLMTGLGLAYATLVALTEARATGKGSDIDVNLFDMALHNLCYVGTWFLNADVNQARVPRSGHPSLVPCQLYRTADGWIFIMCNKEKFWPILCERIGRAEWGDDPRYRTFKDRLERRDEILGMLDNVLGEKTTAEWLDIFAGEVPAAPINDVEGALTNPFVTENGKLETVSGNGVRPDFSMIRTPVRQAGEPTPARAGSELGEDTDSILAAAGYAVEQISELRKRGVI